MSTLQTQINSLASEFARALLRALRKASLDEIVSETSNGRMAVNRGRRPLGFVAAPPKRSRGGHFGRRTEEELQKTVEQIVAVVSRNKDGINAEGIKAALRMDRKELPRPLAMALGSQKIKKTGVKRATKYYGA